MDVGSPYPARFLVEMQSHALNHGMPALRRGGPLLARLGRSGLPVAPAAAALRRLPARPVPQVDLILAEVTRSWDVLAARSDRLPSRMPPLSTLVVQRDSGRFVFVFGGSRHPLLLLKPRLRGNEEDREERALLLAEGAGITPRPLLSVADLRVQEGLPGRPLWVLAPGRPGWSAGYEAAFDALGAGLVRLGELTVRSGCPLLDPALERAMPYVGSATTTALLEAARRDLRTMDAVSLQHHDLSAQNWLVDGSSLVGLVDWETANPAGAPGYDALHAAVSLLEHGVALRTWSQEEVVRTFRQAWHDEPLFSRARSWQRQCVLAATGSERLAEQLVLAYFARRLAIRVGGAGPLALSVETLAALLEIVAGTDRP